jgi:hypothetical protein
MRSIALVAVAFFAVAALPALAGSYAQQHVASVLANTPQIEHKQPAGSDAKNAFYEVKGTQASGFAIPALIDDGFLTNGQEVLIVPLDSGGSGGVFATLLYTRALGKPWQYVGYVPSPNGHLNVHIEQGTLVSITPIYASGDPNCCPSKQHHVRYSLVGTKLKQVGSFSFP